MKSVFIFFMINLLIHSFSQKNIFVKYYSVLFILPDVAVRYVSFRQLDYNANLIIV